MSVTHDDLIAFVYREAELFDDAAFEAWLELFADDAIYWLPMRADQVDHRLEQSITCEDRLLLSIRVERYRGPRTWSHRPQARCQHVLQAPRIDVFSPADNHFQTRTAFFYVETRGDATVTLAGRVTHRLRVAGERLRIVEKRVDLVNAGAALPPIYLLP